MTSVPFRPTAAITLGLSLATLSAGTAISGEVLWWTPDWNQARATEIIKTFEAAHPGITIKPEFTTGNGLPQRVIAALQSGAAPDVIEVQHGWVNGYAQNNLIVPVDDLIEDRDDYIPAALDYINWDGHQWAVPYRVEAQAVVYNRDDFKAAGLDPDNPPNTWDELKAAAAALTRDGRFGFAIPGGGNVSNVTFASLPFIWMNGGSIISDDATTATVNQPAAVAAVQFYTDFFKNGQSPASTIENDGTANRRLFIAHSVSMYQTGQFDIASIQKEAPGIDIGVMPIPHPEDKETAAILGGWSFILPRDAQNPEDAKVFLRFLGQSDTMGNFTDTFPARVSSGEMPRFADPILAVFKGMLPHGRPAPTQKNWVQITQAYFDGIQRILLDEQSVQESMDQANDEIQALLDS